MSYLGDDDNVLLNAAQDSVQQGYETGDAFQRFARWVKDAFSLFGTAKPAPAPKPPVTGGGPSWYEAGGARQPPALPVQDDGKILGMPMPIAVGLGAAAIIVGYKVFKKKRK